MSNTPFARYWETVDQELGATDPAPALTGPTIRSTDFATGYDLQMTSIGPYRIFGYLSVPNGAGPFPAILQTPRYGSVNNPPHYDDRQRYVMLTLMHRGQRLANSPYNAAYPGLLTDGIEDPESWIYRGIVADCLRGAEYLSALPFVDQQRIAIVGDDLALITASRRPVFSIAVLSNLIFYRLMEARLRTDAYPVEEINDLLRLHPDLETDVVSTVSYVDPLRFAPSVAATTLLSIGDPGALGGPEWLEPLLHALPNASTYPVTHEGGTDNDWVDGWMAERMGVAAMPRLWPASMEN